LRIFQRDWESELERCGLEVEIDLQRIQEVLDRDPPQNAAPSAGRLTNGHPAATADGGNYTPNLTQGLAGQRAC